MTRYLQVVKAHPWWGTLLAQRRVCGWIWSLFPGSVEAFESGAAFVGQGPGFCWWPSGEGQEVRGGFPSGFGQSNFQACYREVEWTPLPPRRSGGSA